MDRNLGKYFSSQSPNDTALSSNTYNYTIYTSLSGNFVTGSINLGYVTWSNGTDTSFYSWNKL